jgi:aldehyde dehydrogenase (NAD+)
METNVAVGSDKILTYSNYINGESKLASTEQTFRIFNPANTKECLGEFQRSNASDAAEAVDCAQQALKSWGKIPPPKRGEMLHKAAQIIEDDSEIFSRILTREEGKTLSESRVEVQRAVDTLRYFAGDGRRLGGEVIASDDPDVLLYTIRMPLGVVSIITPWNFPISEPAWKISPALLCGNSVVFKPSSLTPLIGWMFTEALIKAGVPRGVLNFITGPGSTVGIELVRNKKVAAISFTGSYDVGVTIQKAISETGRMPRVQLEMGGKNPLVVLSDADLDKASEIAAKGAFGVTGQACTATSRVIVEESVADEFIGMLAKRAERIRVGDGLSNDVDMGPVVSESELEKDLNYLEIGKKDGAKLVCGGTRLEDPLHMHGFFFRPAVFSHVTANMRIAQEEIFGPIVAVLQAKDFGEAVKLANDTEYGLSSAICTKSLEKANEFVREINAGLVKVNRTTTGVSVQAPFGGMKHSSSMTFKELGKSALDFYSYTKTVYMGIRPP